MWAVEPVEPKSADGAKATVKLWALNIVSGWRQYKGQHRSDMCGLAILDEDNGVIVTDCLGDSLELARELLSEICEAGLVAMVPLVNSSPRARFHLGAAGELLWKDQP